MRFPKTDITRLIAEALRSHKSRSPIDHPDRSVKARHLEEGLGTLSEHGNTYHNPDFLPKDGSEPATGDISMGTHKIKEVVDPTADQEAATKKYVDEHAGGGAHASTHEDGGADEISLAGLSGEAADNQPSDHATPIAAHAADDDAHHALVSIGADAAHSLATQVLSAVAAGAAQVGHVSLTAQTMGAGLKTFADSLATGKFVEFPHTGVPANPAAGKKRIYFGSTGNCILLSSDGSLQILLHSGSSPNCIGGWTFEQQLRMKEDATLSSPGSGYAYFFLDADNRLNVKDENDVVHLLTLDDLAILKSLLTTRGDMIRRGASTPERFAKGTVGKFLKMGADDPDWQWEEAVIEYVIDGGGEVIPTGYAGGLEVGFDCFVTGWTVTAQDGNSGAIVVDVWKDTYANFPPTVADTIAGSEKPTIAATNPKGQDLTLTTWTQALTKGDWLGFNVDSVATLTRVTVSLRVDKYRAS